MLYSVKTDRGRRREINEDSASAFSGPRYGLFIVCDGLGGHLSGEVASSLAVNSITEYIERSFDHYATEQMGELIERSLQWANRMIFKESSENPELTNMGTTAEVALVVSNRLFVGHVGDSRVYLHRTGELKQITRDHSLINDLIDSGDISLDEAKSMTQKNIITRALGVEAGLEVDLLELELEENDIVLLCSDGLTNMVEDEKISDVLCMDIHPEEKAEMLIYMSNSSGGYDNSTIVIVEMR